MDPRMQVLLKAGERALERRDFARALAMTDSVERVAPEQPDLYQLRGRIFAEMADFEQAERAYRRTLALDPDYRGVWHNLGNNAARQSNFREAIRYYRRELEHHPDPHTWLSIGRAYRELGVADSARHAYEHALAIDSTYAPLHRELARLYEEEAAYEEGLVHARRALALEQDHPLSRYLVGLLLFRSGQPQEALPHLRRAVEQAPRHHEAQYALGQVLVRLGREEEAEPVLDRAESLRALQANISDMQAVIRSDPDDPYPHAGLGSLLRQAGRYNDALHAYMIALSLDSSNVEFMNNIAVLHLLRGDHLTAAEWFRRVLQRAPDFVEGWLNLGIVYAKSGQEAQAREAWRHALRHDPDNEQAKAYLARLDREGRR